jgi:hypothetical protein
MFRVRQTYDPNTKTISIHFDGKLTDKHEEEFKKFTGDYLVDGLHFHPNKKPKLKKRKDRVCRFCNKKEPEVSFKKEAHMVPELMGNRNLVSDYECDKCNDLFSIYEDALAKFLGIARTLSSSKGKEGIPTFKNPDKKIRGKKKSRNRRTANKLRRDRQSVLSN